MKEGVKKVAEVKWTNEQLQAIQEKDSNILVAAAAGSGKTAVLVERIIHKIIDEQMDIDKILVVTFTNAAASEMRERILEAIYKKLEENPENVHLQRQIILLNKASICTIHSFCLDVIHNHFYEIDLPSNFKIADTAEIDLLKQEVLDDLFEQKYTENDKDFIELTPHPDGSPFLCLSDFIRPLSSGVPDTIGLFASSVSAESEGYYKDDPYKHLLVQTLTDRLAEAATEKMHEYVRKTVWGYAPDESLSIPDLLVEKYQGIRPAVGYPSLPDQSVNFILDELLDMKQIGITLTENGAMYPHASVCGLMFSHPQSRYFAVGKIGEDQLEDYACRRGKPIEEMRKFLAANLKS